MISHKHKAIFIHIPKAAGSSVEDLFIRDLGLSFKNSHSLLIGNSFNENLGPRQVTHLTAKEFLDFSFISKELYESYFKFAIVRNPYDRLFSIFKYRRFDQIMTFDNFIKFKLEKMLKNSSERFFYKPQFEYVYNDNNLIVDYVGKLENFEKDIKYITGQLNMNHLPVVHKNKSKNRKTSLKNKLKLFIKEAINEPKVISVLNLKNNKTEVLSKSSIQLINEIYENDFKVFGYDKK